MGTRSGRVWGLALALAMPLAAAAATFKVDPDHTGVGFRVKHLFTWVDGRFTTFEGTITFDPAAPAATKVVGSVDVASIDTANAKRDDHLRGADFFDVATHPKITFTSTKVADADAAAGTAKLHGDLTIKGVTRPVVLDAKFLGQGTDPWGNAKAGFSATTTINRKDFDLGWNQVLETGGLLVGEEVEIRIDVEANRQD